MVNPPPAFHISCGTVSTPVPDDPELGDAGDMFKCSECGGQWSRKSYIESAGVLTRGYSCIRYTSLEPHYDGA